MQGSFFRKHAEKDSHRPDEKLEVTLYSNNGDTVRASYNLYNGLYEVIRDTGFSTYILVQEEIPELSEHISTAEDLSEFTEFLEIVYQNLFYTEKATRLAISKESNDRGYVLDALEEYIEARKGL